MYFRFASRQCQALTVWIVLAAWAFHPATEIFQKLLTLRSSPAPVQEMAIVTSESSKRTCQHHPIACPSDCFCPNLSGAENSQGMDQTDSREGSGIRPEMEALEVMDGVVIGRIFEPSLVHCTEKGTSDTSPSQDIFLPDCASSLLLYTLETVFTLALGDYRLRSPYLSPVFKIPIG